MFKESIVTAEFHGPHGNIEVYENDNGIKKHWIDSIILTRKRLNKRKKKMNTNKKWRFGNMAGIRMRPKTTTRSRITKARRKRRRRTN